MSGERNTDRSRNPGGLRSDQSLCVLLPAYNEADNLPEVITELIGIVAKRFERWQILVVDDGSTDDTPEVMERLARETPGVQSLRLRRNSGKSEALRRGFQLVTTDLLLLMDADGQDDPRELDRLLAVLDGGADLVTGRRSVRNDRFIKRNTSLVYNWATTTLTGVDGKDFNSGYKLMRSEVGHSVALYGELHRYIPVLAAWAGFRVDEVEVNHRQRVHGSSKFGSNRFWRGMLDLVTVKFITTYDSRPFHLIGGTGLALTLAGMVMLTWMLVLRLTGEAIGTRPALLGGVTLFVVGVQLVCVGLLAELIVSLDARRRIDDRGAPGEPL